MCARYTLTRDEAVIVVNMTRLVMGFAQIITCDNASLI
jgi:hypothetical protein